MKTEKNVFRKIWTWMNDPRLEKPLMIAAPCLALILAGLILLPALQNRGAAARSTEQPAVQLQASAAPTSNPTPASETSPSTAPSPSAEPLTALQLRGDSVNRDLYVRVLGEDGTPVTGHTFRLDVRFPNGETYSYDTEDDGSSYYLVRLEPGEYTVSMQPYEGYALPEPIRCTVTSSAQYTAIEDIETVANVVDVSQMSQEEVPEESGSAPTETVAEVILEPEPEPVEEEVPVLDEMGQAVYRYEFPLGPNGYLLWSGSWEESNVFPVDEDGDGLPEYGLYLAESESSEDPDAPEPMPYYVSVELFLADGTPVDTFEVIRTPVTEKVEKKTGWQTMDGRDYFLYEDGSFAVGLKQIGGKLYYFDQYGVKAKSVGIDVSFYNRDIDWQTVKAQGIDFAIIRVGGRGWSSGALYDDCRTQEYLRGARAAGIKLGVYFYSTAVNPYEAVEEASVAISTVGGLPLDYPIFIDMEFSGEYPDGRADRLTPSQRADIAVAFCETVRNSGYEPGVYAGQNYMKAYIDYYSISRYTIWLASYTMDNQLPYFDNRYDIWQFTDRGRVNGIGGDVDMNVIF